MSLFKRLSATITGSLDQAITQIENQDAVVDAIVRDARQALAQAKVRLGRVEADAEKMRNDLKSTELSIQQWTRRAQKLGDSDQQKALECLRQRKSYMQQKDVLLERMAQHQRICNRLVNEVRVAESKVSEILNKQHTMRARESAAKAMVGINSIENTVADDLSETFERWEVKVTESELMSGVNVSLPLVDTLEQEFVSSEEDEELRQQLAELLEMSEEKGNE